MNQDYLNSVACVANRLIERGYSEEIINRTSEFIKSYVDNNSIKFLSNSLEAESFVDFLEKKKIIQK